jgi:hypothetical protein
VVIEIKGDVLAAFRREVKKAHPDAGGTADLFRRLVEARDRLLATLGTSAPAPKAPRRSRSPRGQLYVAPPNGLPWRSERRLSKRSIP